MAVETGGTFTDLIWVGEEGLIRTHKVPSTPVDPSGGVIQGLEEALGDEIQHMTQLFHGSTAATNAVLERKGCRAGLITTRGFRDVLAIQRQTRANVYAVAFEKPRPLVPLNLIREVTERIGVNGEVLTPLNERELLEAATELLARGVEALAICFLHSYRTPVHEERAAGLIRDAFPGVPVVLSSAILPAFREYERTSTTAMAAYLTPMVDGYLGNLERYLDRKKSNAALFIMQSTGGVVPSSAARTRAVDMLQSGPAAGVIAATRVGSQLGDRNIITLDMGGTSTDVALITDGAAAVATEKEVDGLPVGVPSVDIANVGAGGGSIGWIDAGGMLHVGPRSAGARPGPACYGHGGVEPAVTDALVLLGWVRPQSFLGGRMKLYPERAEKAISGLAEQLNQTVRSAAQGMIDIAVAHTNRCVRLVSVQRGYDPRDYVIYAYGGMGPVVGALVAQEMKIDRVVIPPHPGLFSALGLLMSDLKRIYRKTGFTPISSDTPGVVAAAFDLLGAEAIEEFAGYGYTASQLQWETWAEMRYRGQGFELPVPIDLHKLELEGRTYLSQLFHQAHRSRYGTAAPNDNIELVSYRLVAQVPSEWRQADQFHGGDRAPEPVIEKGSVTFAGEEHDCLFVRREGLPAGFSISGLAIIEEATATTVVPPGWRMTAGPEGALLLEQETR
ncbi:MAG TPA: hydantoinase/oxoprolinase family protein [Bryobacteraceae bacterium]|nr:hydantoinase/oxoprolinase family protein [Bryobacteraceae bacterium]